MEFLAADINLKVGNNQLFSWLFPDRSKNEYVNWNNNQHSFGG